MHTDPDRTKTLLELARGGSQAAFEELFNRHRAKLKRVIALRMDRRVAARVDASDVLQDTYLEAFKRVPEYLRQQRMPFYLWLSCYQPTARRNSWASLPVAAQVQARHWRRSNWPKDCDWLWGSSMTMNAT